MHEALKWQHCFGVRNRHADRSGTLWPDRCNLDTPTNCGSVASWQEKQQTFSAMEERLKMQPTMATVN